MKVTARLFMSMQRNNISTLMDDGSPGKALNQEGTLRPPSAPGSLMMEVQRRPETCTIHAVSVKVPVQLLCLSFALVYVVLLQ